MECISFYYTYILGTKRVQSRFCRNHTQLTSAVLALELIGHIKTISIITLTLKVESHFFAAGLHWTVRASKVHCIGHSSLVPLQQSQSPYPATCPLPFTFSRMFFFLAPQTSFALWGAAALAQHRSQVKPSIPQCLWRSGAPGPFLVSCFRDPPTLGPAHGWKGYLTFRKWRDREGCVERGKAGSGGT